MSNNTKVTNMRVLILISLLIISGCGDNKYNESSVDNNLLAKLENDTSIPKVNIDSLKEINKDKAIFMGFWLGMSQKEYDDLYKLEIQNNTIGTEKYNIGDETITIHYYTFKFENKPHLQVPEPSNQYDFLTYRTSLNPQFENGRLLGLKLEKSLEEMILPIEDYKIANYRTNETLGDIKAKPKDRLTKEDRNILDADSEKIFKEYRIKLYCSEEIIKLYKTKYGKPEVYNGEYNQVYKKEPIILIWVNKESSTGNQNVIIIEYIENEGKKDINYIRYLDYNLYNIEKHQNFTEKQSQLDKAKNEI